MGGEDPGRHARRARAAALDRSARARARRRDRDRISAGRGAAPRSARAQARGPGPSARGRSEGARRRERGARTRDRGAAHGRRRDRRSCARGSRDGLSRRDRAAGEFKMTSRASAMTRYQRALRRAAKVSIGAPAGALACVVVAVGGVDGAAVFGPRIPLAQAIVATAALALVVIAVIRRAQFAPPPARAQRVSMWLAAAEDLADLELALALVAGMHVIIATTGGQRSPAYPVLYGLVAFSATVLARPGAIATGGAALFLEAALSPDSRAVRSRDEEERLLASGGVGMIGDATSWVLATIKRSLGATTVALLWVDDASDRLRLKDIASEADDITEQPKLAHTGVLGAVLRDRTPLLVGATKPNQIPYYDSAHAGVALIAVPILEGIHLRGILAADRETPFAEADRDLMSDAGGQVLRVVQSEQVFRAVERAKYEHERFFTATAMRGRALTPEQVMETAFDACAAIVEYDAAAIALYDKDRARHRVAAVRLGPNGDGLVDPKQLAELEFKDNAGLASMVVKNRHYLPVFCDIV